MRTTRITFVSVFILLLSIPIASAVELSAGAARVDLTPSKDMNAALGGYGARMSRPAEGVHDRIFAKAVVITDGQRKFAILTADILGFPPGFKTAMVERLESWSPDQIMLLPSHSHTSIDMSALNPKNVFGVKQIGVYDPKLYAWTLDRCVQVIQDAAEALSPVDIGTSAADIDGWNRNRRRRDGQIDPQLTITRIDRRDGAPLAVLVNFTAHPTMMSAEDMLFSGGWPGHMQRALEGLIDSSTSGDSNVTVLYYNGAQGDQSPVSRPNSGSSRWEIAASYGYALAIEARTVWGSINTARDIQFDYHLQSFDLPKHAWHPDFMKTGGDEYGLSVKLLEKVLPLLFPSETTSCALQLGDLVIVGVPGEMTAELGLFIKARTKEITGARYVAIGGLANEWISYILSAEEYNRGGYETSVSFYGAELGDCVVNGAIECVKQLRSK